MYKRILVPYDGSPTSTRGLDEAIAFARSSGGSLRLVHMIDELSFVTGFETYPAYASSVLPFMKENAERLLAEGKARAAAQGVQADSVLADNLTQRLSDFVADEARRWNADLVVLGTHGRRGVGRALLGSDAEQILRTAPVPVLLVRAAPAAHNG